MSEHPDDEQQGPGADDQLPPAPPWLTELLGSLPSDDPPIPQHVADRLDAALAVLTPTAPGAAPPSGTAAPSAPATTSDTPDSSATVVPLTAGSRHRDRAAGRSRLGHRLLLGGVAAAAVVILGGLSTVAVLRGQQSPGVPAVAGAQSTSASPTTTAYLASAQDYTAATLAAGAHALLAQSTGTPTPVPTSTEQQPLTSPQTPGTTPSPLVVTPATVRPSAGCLTELTGSATVTALVAVQTTYDGAPVFIVLSPTVDSSTQAVDPTHVDVWVVQRTCSANDAAMITFVRISR